MSVPFQAGTAVRSIQPTLDDIDNTLHSLMTVRFDETGSPLQVKALACEMGQRRGLLVVFDLCAITMRHVSLIKTAIGEATGLHAGEIIVQATHSHSAPFLEDLDQKAHPFFDLVRHRAAEVAADAWSARRPARVGHAMTHIVGIAFNTRVPMPDGGVKFTRDYREGLASGRPVDPRLNVIRFDDARTDEPIAAWVRVAAHPACVIFNAPVSAEFPGYMTERLSQTVIGGAPVLFSLGACGDVNCIPMFGQESDSRRLGLRLAEWAGPVLKGIQTKPPRRFEAGSQPLELPLAPVPSIKTLEHEIAQVEAFTAALDANPDLEWVLGVNCGSDWSVTQKKSHVAPLAEWARKVRQAVRDGREFPKTRAHPISAWILDDLGLVFDCGEPLVEVGMTLSAQSPLPETLLMAHSNGAEAYLCTDEDQRRGGYEGYSQVRYLQLKPFARPLPYAIGAADVLVEGCLSLIRDLLVS